MIKRLIQISTLALLSVLLLVFQETDSFAQSDYAEQCLEEVQLSEPDSRERALAMFKLTNVLRNRDNLSTAFEIAEQALNLTRKLDDLQLRFVAEAQVESILCLTNGVSDNTRALPKPLEGASSELRLFYYAALLETKIWLPDRHSDFKTLLHEYELAANECDDPYLALQQKALDSYIRVFRLGIDANSIEIQTQCATLQATMLKDNSFPAGMPIIHLINSRALKDKKKFDEQVKTLEIALASAQDHENSFFIIRSNKELALFHMLTKQAKDWKKCKAFYLAAITESERFHATAIASSIRGNLSCAAIRFGQPKTADEQNKKVRESDSYLWLSTYTQHLVDRSAIWIYEQLQDELNLKKQREKALSPNELKKARLEENKKNRDNAIIVEEREKARQAQDKINQKDDDIESKDAEIERQDNDLQKKDAEIERHETDRADLQDKHRAKEAESTKSVQYFQMLTLLFGLLVLILAPWLVVYFYLFRLKRVSNQLESQRESSRQSQEKCDELSLRLNRLQRMESLGLMAGSVAHDFNNILVGVMGNAEVIQLKNESQPASDSIDEFVNERIGSIIRSAEKAANLSRQMLAYAGKQHIARKPTNLNDLIREYDTIIHSACRTGQRLKLELASNPIISKVDPTQIEQVVLNLVTNAVEASSSDGEITIRTGTQRLFNIENDRSLYGSGTKGGEFNFIEISDSGSGISNDDLERIFEPFFSNSEVGRGLGLSVVYGIVIGHDGFIKCCSNVGKGTSFRILIPVSNEVVEEETVEDFSSSAELLKQAASCSMRGKILVIDDEETVLELCKQLMQLNGWEVITAIRGDEGLRLAERHANELSCILLDVVMPEMGANELVRELEARQIDVPVVLMSGFSQTRLEFFLERENVVSIVQKPFRANEIIRAILTAAQNGAPPGVVPAPKSPDLSSQREPIS